MSLSAFDGPAGSGKTHSAIEQLRAELLGVPLGNTQRILALTYMHGARIRLHEQLEKIAELRGRYDASTLDSLAWRICRRWRTRIRELGHPIPAEDDYGANATLSALLLTEEHVRKWVAHVYPAILIDEAQDLDLARLAIIDELAKSCRVIIAFDEFQCLNPRNRPAPVMSWIQGRCRLITLAGSKRTSESRLLSAANQIRDGKPVAGGGVFKIVEAPSNKTAGPVFAATIIGYEMLKDGTFAILTPSKDANYAIDIVALLQTKPVGKDKNVGPFAVRWETGDDRLFDLREQLRDDAAFTLEEIGSLLSPFLHVSCVDMTLSMIKRMHNAGGTDTFSTETVVKILDRSIAAARQFNRSVPERRLAMTIHQAKNREFDRVAVIWPYKIPPSPEDRRRLLYNAVTRARKSCIVVVQHGSLLKEAPFA
jgi:superfamily I DNA/RNA helicase